MIDRVLNGRYRLTSLLGEGGMAVVYEAEDLLLGRRVAVKLLREQFATDPGFLARFQREARAAASLSHPNVVGIYDVGSEGNTQYIVMELVQGRTLKEIIQEESPLPAGRIIDLGRQICEGLDYAHQHQIVHRDVKPHNILVTRDGRAKIADFGIAVALGASSLTQSGYIVGSAQYISPEQARGNPTTADSDLYSTGVVLYEMATGRLPFDGETSVALAIKHIQEEPLPPRRYNPRIPEALQQVILQAMAKDPADRFPSGAAMAQALLACARAGMEATQPHPVATGRNARVERGAAPAKGAVPEKGRTSTGWAVLVVVLAAFLCTLGAIPAAILAYSNGLLGGLSPALATPPSTAPTPEPSPSQAAAKVPTIQATRQPTMTATATPTAIQAPRLVGVPFTTAFQQAQTAGVDLVIVGETYNAVYPESYVVTQKPEGGSNMEKGARIEVVVSKGKEIVTVPRVAGDRLTDAQGKLRSAGLEPQITEEWSDQTPAGIVIAQNPAPDTRTDRGADVYLTVSKGREKVPVPNLVGKPEAEAQDAIVKAGLTKTWVNYQEYTTVPPGHVISQDPKPDTLVEKGTTVYIAVRKPDGAPPAAPKKS